MFDIGPEKLLFLAVLALVFLGPEKLPGVFRSFGHALSQFRDATASVQDELRASLDGSVPDSAGTERDADQKARPVGNNGGR